MIPVFHNEPFVPFDRQPKTTHDSPSSGSGFRRSVAIPNAYLPTAVDAARLRVGARPLDVDQWVSKHDDDWAPTRAMKQILLDERREEVVGFQDQSQSACNEVAAAVLSSLGLPPTNNVGIDALIDAALEVADDLCILMPDDKGIPRLAAAVLCSPNRWRLAEKIGGTMSNIHQPVARYNDDLQSPVDAVMMRLNPQRPLARINWGMSNHPSLFQPDIPPATPAMDIGNMWFRVEWQTLRRLPVSGGTLFTIRTYVEKMSDFMSRDYAVVHDIADLINKIPDDVAQYKSIAPYRHRIFEYLSGR